MNKESEYLVEKLIWNYYQMGEKRFLEWYHAGKKHLEKDYINNTIDKYLTLV